MAPFSQTDRNAVTSARGVVLDAILEAGGGHSGAPVSLMPAAFVLWTRHLRFDPRHPDWAGRDRVVLSNGHACMLQYTVLHLTGYDLTLDDLRDLRLQGSLTPGHPEYRHTAGVEVTTGPLGQGVANAVGMALGNAIEDERTGRAGEERKTWVFAGDGCIMEGVASEASSLAAQWGLEDLVLVYDDNGITIDAPTSDSLHEDVEARYAAYGWDTLSVEDGNDLDALDEAFAKAAVRTGRPTLIRVRTTVADGVPGLEGTLEAHGGVLDPQVVAAAKQGWGLDPAVSCQVSEADYAAWRVRRPVEQTDEKVAAPDLSQVETTVDQIALPEHPTAALRQTSSWVLQRLAAELPWLVGGSADVASSSGTLIEGEGFYGVGDGGRNLLYGVREHAMGAITNGLVIQGAHRAFTGTFLAFVDYMKPSIRLAALMGIPSVFVFSHDSVALGGDGPTHQPVEQLNSLRDIPNLWVLRPGDAAETIEAWRVALTRVDGPTAIVLARQDVGVDWTSDDPASTPYPENRVASPTRSVDVSRGAYVYAEESGDQPELILLATGSELSVAAEAHRRLTSDGRSVRLVSMPCWEAFAAQDTTYREQVIPRDVRARVSIEAGVTSAWHRWVGDGGVPIGVDRFGACTRGVETWLDYGFTVTNVLEAASASLATVGAVR